MDIEDNDFDYWNMEHQIYMLTVTPHSPAGDVDAYLRMMASPYYSVMKGLMLWYEQTQELKRHG